MIKTVYFDRNVLDRIKRQLLVGDHDYLVLRNAVRSGRFIAPLSITQLEETLPIVKVASSVKRNLEQQVMSELLNWDWLIKPHTDLLADDIRSYARGETVSFPFLSLALSPNDFFTPTGEGRKEILQIIEDTNAQIEQQFRAVKEIKKKSLQRKRPDILFQDFWDQFAEPVIGSMAERLGVRRECEERGFAGLLKIKSARLYSIWRIAYDYSTLILGRKIKRSDSRDHHHAVLASVADLFVTQDEPLAKLLRQVKVDGFEVINLNTLLARLQYPTLFGFYEHDLILPD